MRDDEHESLIKAIHEVAGNIRSLAHEINDGRVEPIDRFDYVNNYAYDVLISLLAQSNYAEAEDSDRAPTDKLRAAANPLLAQAGTTIDELYADARIGRVFVLRSAWADMKAAPEYPENAGSEYDTLHYSLLFLDVAPKSPEMFTLLDTNPVEFKRIDKEYALATIYQSLMDNQMMMNVVMGHLKAKHADTGKAGQVKLAEEFASRFNRGIQSVIEEMQHVMARSGLNEEEVKFYVQTRLEMTGALVPDGPRNVQ